MKGKDYAKKYLPLVKASVNSEQELLEIAKDIVEDFQNDLVRTIEARKISNLESAARAVIEVNDKWNALVKIFVRELGASPIKKDGFRNIKVMQTPELAECFKMFGIRGYDK